MCVTDSSKYACGEQSFFSNLMVWWLYAIPVSSDGGKMLATYFVWCWKKTASGSQTIVKQPVLFRRLELQCLPIMHHDQYSWLSVRLLCDKDKINVKQLIMTIWNREKSELHNAGEAIVHFPLKI